MNYAKRLLRIVLIGLLGLMLVTCQKEDKSILDTGFDTNTKSPQFKTGNATNALYDLISTLEGMVADGLLSEGNGNALIVKINAAIASIEKENTNAAFGQLNAFINEVKAFLASAILSPDIVQQLIDSAEGTIDILNGNVGDTFIDPRDGHEYSYAQIGDQVWMTENVAYLFPHINRPSENTDWGYWVYGNIHTKLSLVQKDKNYQKYGCLYAYELAEHACPPGWHLPSDEEWMTLEMFLGMSETDANDVNLRSSGNVGMKLKSTSGWYQDGNGTNESGFNALPAGVKYPDGGYDWIGQYAFFWSNNVYDHRVLYRGLKWDGNWVQRNRNWKRFGISVRCIQN